MINSQDLSNAFARNVAIIKMQADGLTHQDSLRQLPHGNCLNWILGHIAVSRDDVLALLGESPEMDASGARYKRGSDPLTGADEGTLPLPDLLNWLDRTQERVASALSKLDETALAREITRGDRKTTLGQQAFFFYRTTAREPLASAMRVNGRPSADGNPILASSSESSRILS